MCVCVLSFDNYLSATMDLQGTSIAAALCPPLHVSPWSGTGVVLGLRSLGPYAEAGPMFACVLTLEWVRRHAVHLGAMPGSVPCMATAPTSPILTALKDYSTCAVRLCVWVANVHPR